MLTVAKEDKNSKSRANFILLKRKCCEINSLIKRSLIAFEHVDRPRKIRSAFRKTGLYTVSFDNFLLHAEGVKDILTDMWARLEQHAKAQADQISTSLTGRQRQSIADQTLLVRPQQQL
jgi:hypothetical protein